MHNRCGKVVKAASRASPINMAALAAASSRHLSAGVAGDDFNTICFLSPMAEYRFGRRGVLRNDTACVFW